MTAIRNIILSCEHAGNRVPLEHAHLWQGQAAVLRTHRAYDIGVIALARIVHRSLRVPLFSCDVTRLLVDTNRSVGHRQLFSEFSRRLTRAERDALLARIYHPYRRRVVEAIDDRIRGGSQAGGRSPRGGGRPHGSGLPVIHIALHSFTPVLDGKIRQADIGILYDPRRPGEVALARSMQSALREKTGLRVRRNYPYRGTTDGFMPWLRTRWPVARYRGVEFEFNQRLLGEAPATAFASLGDHVCRAVGLAVDSCM